MPPSMSALADTARKHEATLRRVEVTSSTPNSSKTTEPIDSVTLSSTLGAIAPCHASIDGRSTVIHSTSHTPRARIIASPSTSRLGRRPCRRITFASEYTITSSPSRLQVAEMNRMLGSVPKIMVTRCALAKHTLVSQASTTNDVGTLITRGTTRAITSVTWATVTR